MAFSCAVSCVTDFLPVSASACCSMAAWLRLTPNRRSGSLSPRRPAWIAVSVSATSTLNTEPMSAARSVSLIVCWLTSCSVRPKFFSSAPIGVAASLNARVLRPNAAALVSPQSWMTLADLPNVLSTAFSDSLRLLAAAMVVCTNWSTLAAPRCTRSATRIPPAILPTSANAEPRPFDFLVTESTAAPTEPVPPPSTVLASLVAPAAAESKPALVMSFDTTRISTTLPPVGEVTALARQRLAGVAQRVLHLEVGHGLLARLAVGQRTGHGVQPCHDDRLHECRLLRLDAGQVG